MGVGLIPGGVTGLATTGGTTEYRFIQAPTAATMTAAVERERAAIVSAFPAARLATFDMMGGGAGAVHQCVLGFDEEGMSAPAFPPLAACSFAFIAASEPQVLATSMARAIAAAPAMSFLVAEAGAGAGAGALFMVGLAFAIGTPPPPTGDVRTLQKGCTGMEVTQTVVGPTTPPISVEKSPGVPLRIEFPSVMPGSVLDMQCVIPQVNLNAGSSTTPFDGYAIFPILKFPDDAIPDVYPMDADTVATIGPTKAINQNPGTNPNFGTIGQGWSFCWPVARTIPFGGPPAGRVRLELEIVVAGDSSVDVSVNGGAGADFCPGLSMAEESGVSIQ